MTQADFTVQPNPRTRGTITLSRAVLDLWGTRDASDTMRCADLVEVQVSPLAGARFAVKCLPSGPPGDERR